VDNLTEQNDVKGKEGCFVATACYGYYNAPEVLVLRAFRDNILMQNFAGRLFVKVYYFISPPLAKFISKSEKTKAFIRNYFLKFIIAKVRHGQNSW
jgi:hypothetical protein